MNVRVQNRKKKNKHFKAPAQTIQYKSNSLKEQIFNFLDYLSFFAQELKKGISEEDALLKAYQVYNLTKSGAKDDLISANFTINTEPISFKARWRGFLVNKHPNLILLFLIDSIAEMLEIDPIQTGIRLIEFLPLLQGYLKENEAWKLVCEKSALQILKESFELPLLINNLAIGDVWMLIFLLNHFNISSKEIKQWKYDCSILDSTIPSIIRYYTYQLLNIKCLLPFQDQYKDSITINWSAPIPIFIPCPKCRTFTNLPEKNWQYLQLQSPHELQDYHKCPFCKRSWTILHPHTDENWWNLK
ncbi:MAG: hypothetical protein ACTSRS_13540 [Candidatus Helarchaeota archaeon]